MQLFFRKIGETGPPIVILHGVFGSADNWATIQKHIAEAGYTSYALDARNHGRSPWSDDFSYEIMADDLMKFVDSQVLINPIIIGHSMGGKVAMQFAMKYPEAFSKLIVVDIAPKFYPSHHGHILQAFNLIDLTLYNSRNEVDAEFAKFVPDFGERQFLMKNLGRNENNAFEWKINVPVLSREIYQIGGEMTDVKTVVKPTLFIKGERSPYIEEEDFSAIKSIFMNAQIETVEGAGHWVQAEKPKEFLEIILKFLS
jgi:esterase